MLFYFLLFFSTFIFSFHFDKKIWTNQLSMEERVEMALKETEAGKTVQRVNNNNIN